MTPHMLSQRNFRSYLHNIERQRGMIVCTLRVPPIPQSIPSYLCNRLAARRTLVLDIWQLGMVSLVERAEEFVTNTTANYLVVVIDRR